MDSETDDVATKKKFTLTFVPSKLHMPICLDSIKLPDRCTPSPPSVNDHVLEIVPKPTLLGKQQAKKRLKAFAKASALAASPSPKKVAKVVVAKPLEVSEEKFDEHGLKTEEMVVVKKPPKKGVNHDDKSKVIIEQIEAIKKSETKLMEDALQRTRRSRSRDRDRRNSRGFDRYGRKDNRTKWMEKHHHSAPSTKSNLKYSIKESGKYPESWAEMKERNLTFEKLKYMSIKKRKSSLNNTEDIIKMMKFKSPAVVFTPFKYKKVNGDDDTVPMNLLRYTEKSPRIAYSVNHTVIKQLYFNRKQVFDVVSRYQKQSINAIIEQAGANKTLPPCSAPTVRNWFSKSVLPEEKTCEVLEPSTGLSILQSYTDEEERMEIESEEIANKKHPAIVTKITAKKEESKPKKEENKRKSDKEKKIRKRKVVVKKSKKKRKKKRKKKHKETKKTEEGEKVKITEKTENFDNMQHIIDFNDFDHHKSTKEEAVNDAKEFIEEPVNISKEKNRSRSSSLNKEEISSKKTKQPEKKSRDKSDTRENKPKKKKEEVKKSTKEAEKRKSRSVSKEKKSKKSRSVSADKEIRSPVLVRAIKEEPQISDNEIRTPDTDEYHSHWESEDEMPQNNSKKKPANNSWESDDEDVRYQRPQQKTQIIIERSLEMPLNINFVRPRESFSESSTNINEDSWERGEYLKLRNDFESQELKLARQTLSDERKQLEKEKRKVEEMSRRIALETDDLLPEIKKEVIEFECEPGKTRSRRSRWEDSIPEKIVIKEEKLDDVGSSSNTIELNIPISRINLENSKPNLEVAIEESIIATSEEPIKEPIAISKAVVDEIVEAIAVAPITNDLEDEYEEFMKAVSSNTVEDKVVSPSPKRQRSYSTSSTDSSLSSTSSSSSSSSSSGKTEPAKEVLPVPVPLPVDLQVTTVYGKNLASFNETDNAPKEICKVDSTSSPSKNSEPDEKKSQPIEPVRSAMDDWKPLETEINRSSSNERSKRSRSRELRDVSPKRRRGSPRRSPYRSRHSPSRKRRDYSPRRRDSSPKRRSRHSPTRHRYNSPKRRDYSPRYRNRSLSPRNKKRSLSPSKERREGQSIQQTLSRIAGLDRYDHSNKSPINSPIDGFRRSLADSTISDDQLLQNQETYAESPAYYNTFKSDVSPKRLPLDDRINQAMGIEKPISTTYSQNFYDQSGYYDQYGQYYETAKANYDFNGPPPNHTVSKVVQVGNMLQVVPTEDILPVPVGMKMEPEVSQKILQVGNMLQIVPTPIVQEMKIVAIPPPPPPLPVNKEKQSAEDLMKLKIAERMAEREKRRQERDKRRKEKEKKRKERERRRQLKIKQKTEEMIKRALQIDTLGVDEEEEPEKPLISVINILRPAGKGILCGPRNEDSVLERPKKGVKFADGVIPGEGTSPSGGEELSSPPPVKIKLPKEKRFTKTKKPKKVKLPKKKVKVKIVRKAEPELEEEDNLPPPSPPPGSPPPHIFPPRVKIPQTPPSVNHNYVPISPQINYPYNQPALPDFGQPPPQLSQPPPQIGQIQLPPLSQPPPQLNMMHHHLMTHAGNHSGTTIPQHLSNNPQHLPGPSQHPGTPQHHPGTPQLHPGTPMHHGAAMHLGLPLPGTPQQQHHQSPVGSHRHHQSKQQFNISISSPQNTSSHHHHHHGHPHHG